ncbi:MAG: hypothetical protein M1828_006058 [Chrysothrix sp. TS-e1954]|nr:MAG: hypothetical protein M1828_006058 [Chrysothrix sp. TS-e1954]
MSRFVREGAADELSAASDQWAEAEQSIQSIKGNHEPATGRQQDGRTLYEVLQANKAAKQEAFEEASKLKNQFRALDDEEVDFLDSVLHSSRSKDAALQKETFEQLEQFRKKREDAERDAKVSVDESAPQSDNQWARTTTKRKKPSHDTDRLKGIKLRKRSSDGTAPQMLKTPSSDERLRSH